MEITLEKFLEDSTSVLTYVAKFYAKSWSSEGIEFDDLYQVGCLTLVEKYCEYGSSKGSISDFAYSVVKSAMVNYLRDHSTYTKVSSKEVLMSKLFDSENEVFFENNGRYMTFEEQRRFIEMTKDISPELSSELVEALNEIRMYHYNSKILSIDDIMTDDSTMIPEECLLVNIEEEIVSNVYLEEFLSSLTYLSDREKDIFFEILGLYDNIPKRQRYLADKYSISESRVGAIYRKTLRRVGKKSINKLI